MNENLTNYMNSITPEQRQENAKKAGQASAKARQAKKLWRESVELITSGVLTETAAEQVRQKFNIDPDVPLTHQDEIIAAVTEKAKRGDNEAAKFLRDTVGQNPQIMLKVGNLEDKPFQTIDLGSLTDEQLRALADKEQPT